MINKTDLDNLHEIEKIILKGCLYDRQFPYLDGFSEKYFTLPTHQQIALLILQEYAVTGETNYISVGSRSNNAEIQAYVGELDNDGWINDKDLAARLEQLKSYYQYSCLDKTILKYQTAAKPVKDILVSSAETLLKDISAIIDDNLEERQIESIGKFKPTFSYEPIATGINELDYFLNGGIYPSYLYTIGAYTSHGKTLMAMGIALNVALKGIPVFLFSLEMSKEAIFARLTKMNGNKRISEDVPIHVDDTRSLTLAQLRGRIKAYTRQHKIKLFIVDYVQLVKCPKVYNVARHNELDDILSELQALALECKVAIIVLSQVGKYADQNETLELSDLRDSAAMAHASDVVILLKRQKNPNKNFSPNPVLSDEEKNKKIAHECAAAHLHVAKNRHEGIGTNRIGMVYLDFNKNKQMFEDWCYFKHSEKSIK